MSNDTRIYGHVTMIRRRRSGGGESGGTGWRPGGGPAAMADNTLIIKQKGTLPVSKTRQDKSLFRSLSDTYLPLIRHRKPDPLCATAAEGASDFCQTMPPSDRQLMSIGASEHQAFVRAKARFAGQKAQEHSFVRRNAVLQDILPCFVGGISVRLGQVAVTGPSGLIAEARRHQV